MCSRCVIIRSPQNNLLSSFLIFSQRIIAVDVSEIYKQREDYAEGITEIFVALAAKSLDSLIKSRATTDAAEQHSFYAKQVVAALESADENHRMHEYTWVIKGFFEIIQGDTKRAEDHFKTVYDRASKGQNYSLKKHLFVSLLGLVSDFLVKI